MKDKTISWNSPPRQFSSKCRSYFRPPTIPCTPLQLFPKEAAILSSWIVDSSKPYNVRPFKPIFKMCQEAVKVERTDLSSMTHTKGDEVMQLDKSQQNAVGLDGSYSAFTADAKLKLGSTSNSNRKKEYHTYQNWWCKKKTFWKALEPSDYLTEDAKRIIKDSSAEEIVSKLGSFYANNIYIGGIVVNEYTFEYSRSKSSADVAAEFSAKYGQASQFDIGGHAKHNSTTFQMSSGTSVTHKWTSAGGDSKIWAEIASDASNKEEVRKKWVNSLHDDNMEPSKVYLVPIWKVIKKIDKNKAEQVEHYLRQSWRVAPGNVKFLRNAENQIFSEIAACELMTKSCWNVDELGRGCNAMGDQCLKNFAFCNAGDIYLPPGVSVEMYDNKAFAPFDDLCKHGKYGGSFRTPGVHRTLNLPCAYKFSLDTSKYVC